MLTDLFAPLTGPDIVLAVAITLLAAFIKGAVGFAMPMVMISGLSLLLGPKIALAALILPTVVSNAWQALRNGPGAAWAAVRTHRVFLAIGALCLIGSAQLVTLLDAQTVLLLIGVPIVLFAAAQLLGWRLRLTARSHRPAELIVGGFAGFVGGVSGVWGPPTVVYLTALDTPKADSVRAQGVIYGLGAVLLLVTHLQTGVLNRETVPLSAALVVPGILGMWVGQQVQDRLNQTLFRRATLLVLVIAGLNLVRRGLTG